MIESYKRLSGNFVVLRKKGRGNTSPQSIIITFLLLKNYFVKSTEIKYVLLSQMLSTKKTFTNYRLCPALRSSTYNNTPEYCLVPGVQLFVRY